MADQNQAADQALHKLVQLLDLERIEDNLFRGLTEKPGWKRVYGGLVLGQALVAAIRTVPVDRQVHSMHAYFLLGGDPSVPILYDVERLRDGASFTTRRVRAIQHGRPIFVVSASFHKHETGLEHQIEMPNVPGPDEVPDEVEFERLVAPHIPPNMSNYLTRDRPIEARPIDTRRYQSRDQLPPVNNVWFRARGNLPDDPGIHKSVLAYASDFTLLDTALIAHGRLLFDPDIQLASLDHALWFHRPFRADDWLLYAQDSPTSQGSRGFCRGHIFSRSGELVASVAQEGLIRLRSTDFVVQ